MFAQTMAGRLPPTMVLPNEFSALFEWIEASGFFMASGAYPGDKLGLIGTEDDVQAGRVTAILFRIATSEQAREFSGRWLGEAVAQIERRLVPFARTGGDGSHVAFWLDDEGHQRIVHLGSEGLACLMGQTPLDFLRLIAIGYEEISGDCLDMPDEAPADAGRNVAYRAWLEQRFGVTIPARAADILAEVPGVLVEASNDPFWRWVREQQQAGS